MTTNLVELALAVSSTPLSLDRLLAWKLVSATELWTTLDQARQAGRVSEVGPGQFRIANPESAVGILCQGQPEDFLRLTAERELIPDLLVSVRRLREARQLAPAGSIVAALLKQVPPEDFPAGERDWMRTVLDSIRLFRRMYGLPVSILDRAVSIAEASGDLASQAVFLAARGMLLANQGRVEDAAPDYERAREAADSVGGRVRSEVYAYIAVQLVTAGHLREGIAAFEQLLGDVPDTQVASGEIFLLDESPSSSAPFNVLAHAYQATGQYARALDLLHGFLAAAAESKRPALVASAHLYLAWIHAHQGAPEAVPHMEQAWAYFSADPFEPLWVWYLVIMLVQARAAEGKTEELGALLAAGLAGWTRAGRPPFFGTILFELDRHLEVSFLAQLGLDLVAEARRSSTWQNLMAASAAHLFLARQLGRDSGDPNRDQQIAEHLEQAVGISRRAGTLPALARALAAQAEHAERTGHAQRACALREEQTRVRNQLPGQEVESREGRTARIATIILGLGRLAKLGERQEGLWGELAARLAEGLAAERIALAEGGSDPRLLAVRGGGPGWREEVLQLCRQSPANVQVSRTESGGIRIVVPFGAGEHHAGIVVLENQHTRPLLTETDGPLLAALGIQLGVLFGNTVLWRQLSAAQARLEQENQYFRAAPAADGSGLVAHSRAMLEVLDLCGRVATTTSSVLILGETGVGKEVVAREIHRRSARSGGPFIAVHIAALAPGLVSSGLFGHERGAFTGATERSRGRFELADGGTLFLDEIGELSLEDQVRLLRVLQDGTFERVGGTRPLRSDFRLLAATNRDLEQQVRAGRFREDLYFRLNVFPIRIAPLRQRREEIPTLALMFMERFARNVGRAFQGISEADMERLCAYPWPGNVRELEHVIERAVILSDGPRLKIPELAATGMAPEAGPRQHWPTLEEVERRYIAEVLAHVRGRIAGPGGAAEILALNPSTLNWRIDKLGLRESRARARSAGPRTD